MNDYSLIYLNSITTEYDNEFCDDTFRWTPWIGKNYSKHKILILGERQHGYWKLDGDELPKDPEEANKCVQETVDLVDSDKEFTRWVVYKHGINNYCERALAHRNFNKTLLLNKSFSLEQRKKIWSSVAFMNGIQKCMDSHSNPCSKEQCDQALNAFSKLVDIIKPELCIIWSPRLIDRWAEVSDVFAGKYKKGEKINGMKERIIEDLKIYGHTLSASVIHHPTLSYSRQDWHEYLINKYGNKITQLINH